MKIITKPIRIDLLPRLIAALEERDVEVDVKMAHLQRTREANCHGFTTEFAWQHDRISVFPTSMWRHPLGLHHNSMAHLVIDQVIIKNYLPRMHENRPRISSFESPSPVPTLFQP